VFDHIKGIAAMKRDTIEMLRAIDNEFYREQARSFSDTRRAPWNGWRRCLDDLNSWASMSDSMQVSSLDVTSHALRNSMEPLSQSDSTRVSPSRATEQSSSATDNALPFHRVLDLACGNMRFESFCLEQLDNIAQADTHHTPNHHASDHRVPDMLPTFYAVDNCDALVSSAASATLRAAVRYRSIDIIKALINEDDLNKTYSKSDIPLCDCSVSFGFMHHVPSFAYRERVLKSLVNQTQHGGYVAVSFWQFMNCPALANKAQITHERASHRFDLSDLEPNDYLLGWEKNPDVYRYCHHFSDDEIDCLLATVADMTTVADRFVSDGRTNSLNSYAILRIR
jgi:SAM-dependent methyltransferase